MTAPETPDRLELRRVTKRFGAVVASDDVSLTLRAGEVHALVGENGAGKSTIVKMLAGIQQPDSGEILVDGVARRFRSPEDAIAAGIGTVHQHFMLFPSLTVAENVVYGREPRRRGLFDAAAAERSVRELAERHSLPVDPGARVGELPVGVRQRVEVLKALYRGARILLLDEPTAVLTPTEVDQLVDQARRMAEAGTAVLFVSHKMREIKAISDRITVLRFGQVQGELPTAGTEPREIVRLMVGRDVVEDLERPAVELGEVVLRVEDLVVLRDDGTRAVDDVTLEIRAGEVVGVAGVAGNGQSELIAALVGLRGAESGRVLVGGRDVTALDPRRRRRLGVAYIPEDRNREGVATDATVEENLSMGAHDRPPLARQGVIRRGAVRSRAVELVRRFAVRTPDTRIRAGALSGGNVQKLVVARELAERPTVLVAAEPTRGVDVAAMQFVHEQILAARVEGTAVLVVSSELSEIRALADRAVVMFNGTVSDDVDPRTADAEEFGALMAGTA